jgi:hypothetical protein
MVHTDIYNLLYHRLPRYSAVRRSVSLFPCSHPFQQPPKKFFSNLCLYYTTGFVTKQSQRAAKPQSSKLKVQSLKNMWL